MPRLLNPKTSVLVVIFVLLLSATGFLLYIYHGLQVRSLELSDSVSEYKIYLDNEGGTVDYLRSQGFLGSNGVNKVVVAVAREVENPFLVQRDKDGNMIISTAAEVIEDTAIINIAIGDYIINNVEPRDVEKWLDSQFWEAVDLLYKKMSQTSRVGIESNIQSVFSVEKMI